MAKNEKLTENLVEDPAALVTEETEAPKPAKQDAKDKRIAELEKQLAEAKKLNAAYTKGDDYSAVKQKCQEAVEKGLNPWDILVTVRVPARRDCNDPYYWFCVNGRSAQIVANNEYQEMKLPYAEALVDMLRMEKHAQTFADEKVQMYDPVTNPHPDDKARG